MVQVILSSKHLELKISKIFRPSQPCVLLCLMVCTLLIGGCSSRIAQPSSALTNATLPSHEQCEVIAENFVNIMIQIDALSPENAVLKFGRNSMLFSAQDRQTQKIYQTFSYALRTVALRKGYYVRPVESNDDPNLVKFSIINDADSQDIDAYTFSVSVGGVDLRRTYMPLRNGRIQPYQSMLVKGADASALESDDSIFEDTAQTTTPELAADARPAPSLSIDSNSFNSPLQPR